MPKTILCALTQPPRQTHTYKATAKRKRKTNRTKNEMLQLKCKIDLARALCARQLADPALACWVLLMVRDAVGRFHRNSAAGCECALTQPLANCHFASGCVRANTILAPHFFAFSAQNLRIFCRTTRFWPRIFRRAVELWLLIFSPFGGGSCFLVYVKRVLAPVSQRPKKWSFIFCRAT